MSKDVSKSFESHFGNLKDPITHFYFDQNKSKSRASLENIYLKQNIKSRIE